MAGELGSISGKIEIEYDGKGVAKANDSLKGFSGQAVNEGGKAGKGFLGSFTGAIKGIAAAVGGIFAAIQITKFVKSVINDFTEMRRAIIVGTGASGEALEDLEASVERISKTTPSSFADIGAAVAEVNTRLGLTGQPLEDLSAKFLNLSRITGTDVTQNIRDVTRVFGDWGIESEDQSAALDQLFHASQLTGIGVDKLSQQVVQFGAPLRQMGFNFEESIAIFAKWEREGVNAELAMGGLRQGLARLSRAGEDPPQALARITEEIKNAGSAGEANALAIEAFGARAGPDMAAAIREGRFEIDELVDALGASNGAIADAEYRTRTFSDQWQLFKNNVIAPLVPFVLAAMDSIRQSIQNEVIPAAKRFIEAFKTNVLPTIKELAETWVPRLRAAFSAFVAVLGTVGSVIGSIVGFFNRYRGVTQALAITLGVLVAVTRAHAAAMAVQAAGGIVQFMISYLRGIRLVSAALRVWTAIQWLLNIAMNANPLGLIILAIAALVAAIIWIATQTTWFQDLWKAIWSKIEKPVKAVWDWIKKNWPLLLAILTGPIGLLVLFIVKNWDRIKEIFFAGLAFITRTWQTAWNAVRDFFVGIWDWVYNFIKTGLEGWKLLFTTVLNVIKSTWTNAWNAVRTAFTKVWNAIVSFAQKFTDKIKSTITGGLNNIRTVWNTAWNTVRTVVTNILNAVRQRVQDAINRVKSIIAGVSAIIATVRNAFNSARQAAVDKMNDLISFVRGIPGKIKTALGNLASRLYSAGRDLIQGLINGIKDMVGNAVQAARDAVGSAVDAAKGLLGISSPSTVFIKIGVDTIAGYVKGLQANKNVAKAATTVSKTVRDAATKMLGALKGGTLFEDFSFKGMSKSAKAEMDKIADMFYKGGGKFNKKQVEKFLSGLVAQPTIVASSGKVSKGVSAIYTTTNKTTTYSFASGSITLDLSKMKSIQDVVNAVQGLQSSARQVIR